MIDNNLSNLKDKLKNGLEEYDCENKSQLQNLIEEKEKQIIDGEQQAKPQKFLDKKRDSLKKIQTLIKIIEEIMQIEDEIPIKPVILTETIEEIIRIEDKILINRVVLPDTIDGNIELSKEINKILNVLTMMEDADNMPSSSDKSLNILLFLLYSKQICNMNRGENHNEEILNKILPQLTKFLSLKNGDDKSANEDIDILKDNKILDEAIEQEFLKLSICFKEENQLHII